MEEWPHNERDKWREGGREKKEDDVVTGCLNVHCTTACSLVDSPMNLHTSTSLSDILNSLLRKLCGILPAAAALSLYSTCGRGGEGRREER